MYGKSVLVYIMQTQPQTDLVNTQTHTATDRPVHMQTQPQTDLVNTQTHTATDRLGSHADTATDRPG